MKQTPEWLKEPALQQFFAATAAAGGQARVIGGAVRDFLLGITGGDVDIASTLSPQQTMAIAAQHGWKAIPTGIEHGTVTLVMPSRIIEVTTLRRDVATDGRRATVAYTDSWQEDAARRDFTINAMSMDANGMINDFFSGRKDLATQTIRFIGDAKQRIAEDGLRILRYFRFLASHGTPPADNEALEAITMQKEMLRRLSGERIANEMKKLLAVPNPAFVLRLMMETGAAPLVFGRTIDPSRMIRLHMLETQADYQISVWARLVLLLAAAAEDVRWLSNRWKLSRHETAQLNLLSGLPALVKDSPLHVHTRLLRLHAAPAYLDWLLTQAVMQVGVDVTEYVARAKTFVAPVFPVSAKDLLTCGMTQGKELGAALAALEQRWEESDYTLTKAQLLASE